MTATGEFRVFYAVRFVRSRSGKPTRYRGTWVVRGSGGELYSSRPCDTLEDAERLARVWLAKSTTAVETML